MEVPGPRLVMRLPSTTTLFSASLWSDSLLVKAGKAVAFFPWTKENHASHQIRKKCPKHESWSSFTNFGFQNIFSCQVYESSGNNECYRHDLNTTTISDHKENEQYKKRITFVNYWIEFSTAKLHIIDIFFRISGNWSFQCKRYSKNITLAIPWASHVAPGLELGKHILLHKVYWTPFVSLTNLPAFLNLQMLEHHQVHPANTKNVSNAHQWMIT